MKKIVLSFVIPMLLVFGLYAIHETARAGADATVYYDTDDNVTQLQEFIDAVSYVSNKYGTGDIIVTTEWLPSNVIAETDGETISVNKTWTAGLQDLEAMNTLAVASGFHPGGCSAVTAAALHEAAHVLDRRSGIEARYELVANYGTGEALQGQLSGYSWNNDGTINAPEALANAFQAVECGVANAAEQELYTMLAYW